MVDTWPGGKREEGAGRLIPQPGVVPLRFLMLATTIWGRVAGVPCKVKKLSACITTVLRA